MIPRINRRRDIADHDARGRKTNNKRIKRWFQQQCTYREVIFVGGERIVFGAASGVVWNCLIRNVLEREEGGRDRIAEIHSGIISDLTSRPGLGVILSRITPRGALG